MHAFLRRLKKCDLTRLAAVRDVEYSQSGLRFLLGLIALVIDQHHVAADANFVRVNSFRHFQAGDELGIFWIAYVDDRSTVGRFDMADIGVAILDYDGAAAGQIHATDHFDVLADSDWWGSV